MKLEWLANINAVKLNWKCNNAQKHVKTYDNTWRLQFIEATQNPDQQVFKEQTTFMKSIWQLIWESSFHLFPGFRHWALNCTPYTQYIQVLLLQPLNDSGDYVAACRPKHKYARVEKQILLPSSTRAHISQPKLIHKKINGLEHIPNHINECSCARIWTHCLPPLAKRLRLLYQKLAALSHCLLPLAKRLQELHLTGDALASGYIWII